MTAWYGHLRTADLHEAAQKVVQNRAQRSDARPEDDPHQVYPIDLYR